MNRDQELQLLQRCLSHLQAGSTQQSESGGSSEVSRYLDVSRFALEQQHIFRESPLMLAHASELTEPHAFVTRQAPRGSVLLARDAQGQVRGFHNVCRHRGARLVDAQAGCAERFRCPYHAWTYSSSGELVGVPHQASAFPDLCREQNSLKPVNVIERHGFIWLADDADKLDAWLAPVAEDLQWLNLKQHRLLVRQEKIWRCNWKLIAEGGLESYHFRQAHSATIAPYFPDNCSLVEAFGPHFRTVLPKRSISALVAQPESEWSLREHTHMTYALFPSETLLVQRDHIAWIQAIPVAVDQTLVRIASLVPEVDQPHGHQPDAHWHTNHQITCATLDEDFAMGESIQSGLASGANTQLQFGRNEGALVAFNRIVDRALGS